MLQAALRYLDPSVKPAIIGFELSAFNVDKPPLGAKILLDRMAQVAGQFDIIATNAPTFIEKARLLKNVTFVVGYVRSGQLQSSAYSGAWP
jgi:hypothetical protein